jgi:predicted SAM-dependent methyltransferase
MNQIYPNYKGPTLKSQLYFEIISWLGRHFRKRKGKIKKTSSPLLLDIGAGTNYKKGWTHLDFFTIRVKFWKKSTYPNKPEVETDLRYPLDCDNNIVDGIYSSHTLEHLYPDQAYRLLNEMNRILKPSGWIRIAVPDLKKCIDFYNGKEVPGFNYTYKAEAICHYTQNWGHHSSWDAELLTKALELNNFINIKEVEFGKEGSDPRLIKEEEVRKYETLVLEAQKPE